MGSRSEMLACGCGPSRRSLAVGLFHFNVQYVAGDPACYHRICTEAIGPFLSAVAGHRGWRVSMELAGSGLEFLGQHYPSLTRVARSLVEEGRLELISATYAPTLWVAFPRRDLVRSIEINRKCLQRMGFPVSRVFFAQEALFGLGLRTLEDFFDIAICKDDYLRYFTGATEVEPVYSLGKIRVLVGSNHILNELSASPAELSYGPAADAVKGLYRPWLQRYSSNLPAAPAVVSRAPGVQWFWYHMGSGHHFAARTGPEDWEHFFLDPAWLSTNEQLLESYGEMGFLLSTVTDLASAVEKLEPPPLPTVIEGSWNSEKSEGVFAWMGRQCSLWENDPGILGLSWRARKQLLSCEDELAGMSEFESSDRACGALEGLWKMQLLAESSDSLGWTPMPGEVAFARNAAERVLQGVNEIREHNGLLCQPASEEKSALVADRGLHQPSPYAAAELVGSEGTLLFAQLEHSLQLWEASFVATDSVCGIQLLGTPEEVVYCPSAAESEPLTFRPQDLKPATICLPLSNGLLRIADDLYFIRDNSYGVVAARIEKEARRIRFVVQGAEKGKRFRWRFFLFKGRLGESVERANAINAC